MFRPGSISRDRVIWDSKTGRPVDAVPIASLLGKITEARELFDVAADDEPHP